MPKSYFPPRTLEQASVVARAIEDQNAGKRFNRLDLAKALGLTPGSSRLRVLITASRQYGLTTGNYNSQEIGLTELGRLATGPDKAAAKTAMIEAAMSAHPFTSVCRYYDQKKLPDDGLLASHLAGHHQVPPEQAANCIKTLKANGAFAGLFVETDGALWVRLDRLEASAVEEAPHVESPQTGLPTAELAEQPTEAAAIEASATPVQQKPLVFLAHGKNKKILGQLKDLLKFGGFEPVVAEEEETLAIPVSKKVMDAMHRCWAAIINVSADERATTENGETIFKLNENVLIEIGAAFVLYKKRVILLVDKRVELPSNVHDLYKCEYEGDSLDFDSTMKLQKALTDFRQEASSEA